MAVNVSRQNERVRCPIERAKRYRQWNLFIACLSLTGAAAAQTPLPPVSQPVLEKAKSTFQPGLVAEIYSLPVRPRSLRNPIPGLATSLVKVVATPNIASATDIGGFDKSVQVDFTGEILLPSEGEYLFSAAADDAMDLQIDGKIVLANAWINGNNAPTAVKARFAAGWHPIRVRFYQGDGGFNLKLRWQPPGAGKLDEIPADQFRVSQEQVTSAQKKTTIDEQAENANPSLAHRFVFRTKGFLELPERDADLLGHMLEGPTVYSEVARKDFSQLQERTNFKSLPYWHQVMVLSGFLRGWHSGQLDRGAVTLRAAYNLSEPLASEYGGWKGVKRQGFKHIITIRSQKFTVLTPAADSPERENAAKAIAGLPTSLRGLLKTVVVEPYGTANEFNGGGDQIWVRRGEPTPLSMLDRTISHEIGHLLMNRTDCYLAWQKAVAQDVLSISQYGRMNPSEDFGEFVSLYLSTNGNKSKIESLEQLFPARIRVLDSALKQIRFDWSLE